MPQMEGIVRIVLLRLSWIEDTSEMRNIDHPAAHKCGLGGASGERVLLNQLIRPVSRRNLHLAGQFERERCFSNGWKSCKDDESWCHSGDVSRIGVRRKAQAQIGVTSTLRLGNDQVIDLIRQSCDFLFV